MDVERVRDTDLLHRVEEGVHDLAGGEPVDRDLLVEAEIEHPVLEGRGASRIDALDAEAPRGRHREGDEVPHRRLALALAQQFEKLVVVAHHRKGAAVEQRDVGEFELRRERVGRRHRRLDGDGVAHPRVIAPIQAAEPPA